MSILIFIGFVQTYVTHKNYEIIGGLFSGLQEDDVNTFSQKSPTDKSCYIYRKKDCPEVLVCQCNLTVSPEQAYSFADQVRLKRFFFNLVYMYEKHQSIQNADTC